MAKITLTFEDQSEGKFKITMDGLDLERAKLSLVNELIGIDDSKLTGAEFAAILALEHATRELTK